VAIWILLALLALPLLELYVFGAVGGEIGLGWALLLTLFTAAAGLWIVRWQGLGLMRRVQATVQAGEPVLGDLLEGVLLALAGICLFLPGFVTDALGVALLVPPLRQALVALGIGGMVNRVVRYRARRGPDGQITIDTIDYEVHDKEDEDPDRRR